MFTLIRELVNFRNASHEEWFYFTVCLFLITLLIYVCSKMRALFLILVCPYAMNSLGALIVVVSNKPSKVYSVDCIWFNGVVAMLYLMIYVISCRRRTQVAEEEG